MLLMLSGWKELLNCAKVRFLAQRQIEARKSRTRNEAQRKVAVCTYTILSPAPTMMQVVSIK
jgi:hypothetical protein